MAFCIFFCSFPLQIEREQAPAEFFFFRQSGGSALAESSVTMIRQEHKNKHSLAGRLQSPLQSINPPPTPIYRSAAEFEKYRAGSLGPCLAQRTNCPEHGEAQRSPEEGPAARW